MNTHKSFYLIRLFFKYEEKNKILGVLQSKICEI